MGLRKFSAPLLFSSMLASGCASTPVTNDRQLEADIKPVEPESKSITPKLPAQAPSRTRTERVVEHFKDNPRWQLIQNRIALVLAAIDVRRSDLGRPENFVNCEFGLYKDLDLFVYSIRLQLEDHIINHPNDYFEVQAASYQREDEDLAIVCGKAILLPKEPTKKILRPVHGGTVLN